MRLKVYLPRNPVNPPLGIAPGSAIVGDDTSADGRILVDFEGNLYGAENLQRFEDRVVNAAGRHAARYPTVARGAIPESDLQVIGEIDTTNWQVQLDPEKSAALSAWLAPR